MAVTEPSQPQAPPPAPMTPAPPPSTSSCSAGPSPSSQGSETSFDCTHCGKSLRSRKNYSKHMFIHSGETPPGLRRGPGSRTCRTDQNFSLQVRNLTSAPSAGAPSPCATTSSNTWWCTLACGLSSAPCAESVSLRKAPSMCTCAPTVLSAPSSATSANGPSRTAPCWSATPCSTPPRVKATGACPT